MEPQKKDKKYSFAEYLVLDEDSLERTEFHDGEIIAMAGGTEAHARITFNLTGAVFPLLDHDKCWGASGDLKIFVEQRNKSLYPDLSITCSEPEYYKNNNTIIKNPTVIFEVLSKSTEAYDRGEKFHLYKLLPSFREYVLISQDKIGIDTFYKKEDGSWIIGNYWKEDQKIKLYSIDSEISVKAIYRRIEFQ